MNSILVIGIVDAHVDTLPNTEPFLQTHLFVSNVPRSHQEIVRKGPHNLKLNLYLYLGLIEGTLMIIIADIMVWLSEGNPIKFTVSRELNESWIPWKE